MRPVLRVILDERRAAAFNMAADQYLLGLCEEQEAVFLRLYAWEKPSISIGCMQNPETLLDKEAMASDGVDWVRRPTGGRAVLHHEDITYASVFSKTIEYMGASISETYAVISGCLIRGLGKSGILCNAHQFVLDTKGLKQEVKLPCYLAPNRNEIMVNGRKLVGSAQKRSAQAVLQHGSIPLSGKFRTLPLYQKLDDAKRQAFMRLLEQKCICIQECVSSYSEEQIRRNLIQGFADTVPFELQVEPWSNKEEDAIHAIAGNGAQLPD